MPKICPRYAQDMPKICLRYARDMPNICPRYAQGMPEICLRYAQDMLEICPRYAKEICKNKLGQNVLGQNVHFLFTKVGAKCPGAKCPWGKMSPSRFNSSSPKHRSRYKLPQATDHDNGEEQLVLELLGAGELLQLVEGIESVQPEKKESEYGKDESE